MRGYSRFSIGVRNGNRNGKLLKSDDGNVKYTGLVSKVRYGCGVRVENLGTGKGLVFFPVGTLFSGNFPKVDR